MQPSISPVCRGGPSELPATPGDGFHVFITLGSNITWVHSTARRTPPIRFLHGVAVHKSRGHGRGVLDLNGIKGLLSFRYADYKGELKDLRGIKTLEAIVQYIRQQ